jgi:anti-sigma B factor antagonist
MDAFTVTDSTAGAQGVLRLCGEFDIAGADDVVTAAVALLDGRSVTELVLDLSGVTFIDSTGIGTLVAVRNLAREARVTTRLQDPRPGVASLLALTAVDRLFEGDQEPGDADSASLA